MKNVVGNKNFAVHRTRRYILSYTPINFKRIQMSIDNRVLRLPNSNYNSASGVHFLNTYNHLKVIFYI